MTKTLICLHDEALRMTHPIFKVAPAGAEVIFVWDDVYFQQMDYSFKRLVFIYETIAQLPINIVAGEMLSVLQAHQASEIFIPTSHNQYVEQMIAELAKTKQVRRQDDDIFVQYQHKTVYKRFFQYWKKIEKLAFMRNGEK